ncbi:MAG: adenosylcobinamide-phosphate synthase CbiB [Pseudomonadota bacterium]
MLLASLSMLAALALDRLLGEPSRWHPLVAFGGVANWLEQSARRWAGKDIPDAGDGATSERRLYASGVVCCVILVALPVLCLALVFNCLAPAAHMILSVAVLYFCLGARSLTEHAQAVGNPLSVADLDQARAAVSAIVSRDTDELDAEGLSKATIESVLENGNDAVLASLFWFALAGAPGAVAHRLLNTLDAMWGYRSTRYRYFGWASARLDDVFAWLPARCCALGYALVAGQPAAVRLGFKQAKQWDSPNAGPVMAVGAVAMDVEIGGPTRYSTEMKQRPTLGSGRAPQPSDIDVALRLVSRTSLLFIVVVALAGLLA